MKKNLLALAIAIPLSFVPFLFIYALGSLNIYYYEMFIPALVSFLSAGFFWLAYFKTRLRSILIVSIVLSLYTLLEIYISFTYPYGDPVIRIDLLLIIPILYVLFVIGLWSLLKWRFETQLKM